MTADDLSKLTPEQKRICIAEACGLTLCPTAHTAEGRKINGTYCDSPRPFVGSWRTRSEPDSYHGPIPKYDSDLNAMHEAERALPDDMLCHYAASLYHMTVAKDDQAHDGFIYWDNAARTTRATAAQRADAFLLTI